MASAPTFVFDLPLRQPALPNVHKVAVDDGGNVYAVPFVFDVNNAVVTEVVKVSPDGRELLRIGAGQFDVVGGLAVDAAGNIYVSDTGNHRVQKYDAGGLLIAAFGEFGSGVGQFDTPAGITLDLAGNIYVCDSNNGRVQKFDGSFVHRQTFGVGLGQGDGQLDVALSAALDAAGNVYVAEFSDRIVKFASDGTFAGWLGGARGLLPVAILTTPDFAARTVDVRTVQFGPGTAMPRQASLTDVDGDGDRDLLLHFETRDTGIACGQTAAELTAATISGATIAGTDNVRPVPCKSPRLP